MGSLGPLLFQWGKGNLLAGLWAPQGSCCPSHLLTYPGSLVGVHALCFGSVNLVPVWFSDIPAASAIVSETQELLQEGEREGVR